MSAALELPAIGDFYEGGYFAGLISHTANGVATHGLIVAPASSGYNGKDPLAWKTVNTNTDGTLSEYDGAINTAAMADNLHPAADYCANLTINGYSDWYLPAIAELEIAYYNLKPTGDLNATADSENGKNDYSVPKRTTTQTLTVPPQTSVMIFEVGEVQEFVDARHWSSTQSGLAQARNVLFKDGDYGLASKTNLQYVRAFRKFAL